MCYSFLVLHQPSYNVVSSRWLAMGFCACTHTCTKAHTCTHIRIVIHLYPHNHMHTHSYFHLHVYTCYRGSRSLMAHLLGPQKPRQRSTKRSKVTTWWRAAACKVIALRRLGMLSVYIKAPLSPPPTPRCTQPRPQAAQGACVCFLLLKVLFVCFSAWYLSGNQICLYYFPVSSCCVLCAHNALNCSLNMS